MVSLAVASVAGLIKGGAFAMLITEPEEDIDPYHDRQIVVPRTAQPGSIFRRRRPSCCGRYRQGASKSNSLPVRGLNLGSRIGSVERR